MSPIKRWPLLALALALPAFAQESTVDPNAIRVLISPELETTLGAQLVGQISTLNASLGQQVTKGETLAVFNCGEEQAKLRMAQAEYKAAKETRETKARMQELNAAGELEVSQAAAAAERALAAISLSRAQLAHCVVKAPFSGRLVKVHVKPHQGVNLGNPLLELVSDSSLKVRLNVPSTLLRQLKVGSPFEVSIDDNGKTYAAQVTAINARVDAVARTVELEGRIDGKPEDLLAGMTGIARFPQTP
ncbi:efflux RND transporter periplasmic adaptor subunit [Azomonas macrocytogenes]|uniref:RND family efflux transporter MFP subunit n=1 Tax=Azomonas macrocytogenes TaxID=69962 RepID=A0A839SYP0_AZOMA|nr:efflux RND transporter periplasmic adaptor subunit [Azomonas macrocytogenes]MBB3102252.1 RND family efflux transporter MFP subunit [Azomonas macrocytogenes]